jgi:hypothetical protein
VGVVALSLLAGAPITWRPALGLPSSGALSLTAPLVFDPKLDPNWSGPATGHATATVQAGSSGTTGSLNATITVVDGQGNTVRTLDTSTHNVGDSWSDSWDGSNDAGQTVAPGSYTLTLATTGAVSGSVTAPINVVRLGARAIQFLDTGTSRVPLTYHAANGQPRSYFAIDSGGPQWTLPASTVSAGALDDATGAPLVAPAPWANVQAPPTDSNGVVLALGRSLPLAYVGGSTMNIQLTLGDTTFSAADSSSHPCGYPIQGVALRVHAGGTASGAISPGSQATVPVGYTVPTGLTRTATQVAIFFEYQDANGWEPVPGQQTTTHMIYSVNGLSQVADTDGTTSTDARQTTFVAAVDTVTGWAATSSSADAMTTITRAVNGQMGLTYDIVSGADAYADGDPANPTLAFSEFLSNQSRGKTVNCADCAALVGMFSRSVGVDVQSCIVGNDFPLNYILGIGATQWKSAIFTNGGASFSFHAIATTTAGKSIYDACLAVDDGPHPDQVETRIPDLPINMDMSHYMSKLTPSSFSIQSLGRPTQY